MKLLLIADVGTNSAGFYHVGDEAMLYQTVQWYQEHEPQLQLGVLSRSLTHDDLSVTEFLHLPFPKADFWLDSPWYCLSLLVRFFIWRITSWPVLRKTEAAFVQFVNEYDCLHFVGGGNIYSYHAPWLYYVFFLLFLGKQLHKKIWLTSQTLGPFNWFDRYLAQLFLSLSDVIVLRGHGESLGLKTLVGLDAAYDLQPLAESSLSKKSLETFRIGLSLHAWKNFGPKINQVVVSALTELAKTQKLELVVLPHVFTQDVDSWDPAYMAKIVQQLPPEIKVRTITASEILESAEPTAFVKTVTAELDLMLATRYHALVFALSSNVPVLTFELDDYYVQKNSRLLELVYQDDWQRFVLSVTDTTATQLQQALQTIQRQLAQEQTLLKKQNLRLRHDSHLSQLSQLVETLH